ncbi:MAG: DMT family transporter [Candidatus Brocadiae bacterium]|nr:DMT family transporter [Candidatus Brocadiia bacterium]
MSQRRSGYACVFAAALLWSLGGMFVKVLVERFGAEPRAVACLRSLFAGLVLVWALPRLGGVPRVRVGITSLVYALVVGTFVFSTAGTSAANAILLQYSAPLLVAVGAVWFLGERLGGRQIGALALGVGGVAAILAFTWGTPDQRGVLYGLGSAVAFASLMLLQRSMRSGSPVALSCVYNLTAGVVMLPLAWGALRLSPGAWLVVALMGTVQLGIPYALFIRGIQRVPATDAALITLVEPVLNPVWVWLAVREEPHWSTFVGGALILAGLLVRFAGARPATGVPSPD